MTFDSYKIIGTASVKDRQDLFLETANRLGVPVNLVSQHYCIDGFVDYSNYYFFLYPVTNNTK